MIDSFQPHEAVTLLVGFGVLFLVVVNRRRIRDTPHGLILVAAYLAGLFGWTLSLLESLRMGEGAINYLEHPAYAAGRVFLATWCWKAYRGGRVRD
jgi:hypothetical protein